ncbi:thioredoxin family protein [Candidatus Kaiserbacteria bacterium]|nr:thioredoxin family protein [Candidatus Kaiserbacteria bacterium]
MNNILMWGIAVIIILGGGYYWYENSQQDAMMKDEGAMMDDTTATSSGEGAMMDDLMSTSSEDAMMEEKGTYEPYAPEKLAHANSGNVVLFFRATWCPTCKVLDADIRSHLSDIPGGLTILDVDYDTSSALKQKYGVTYQHTLVQVRSDGSMISKWSGSPTLAALAAEVQ